MVALSAWSTCSQNLSTVLSLSSANIVLRLSNNIGLMEGLVLSVCVCVCEREREGVIFLKQNSYTNQILQHSCKHTQTDILYHPLMNYCNGLGMLLIILRQTMRGRTHTLTPRLPVLINTCIIVLRSSKCFGSTSRLGWLTFDLFFRTGASVCTATDDTLT